MDIKSELKRYRAKMELANALERQMSELEGTMKYRFRENGERVQGGDKVSIQERYLMTMDNLKDRQGRLIKDSMETRTKILDAISVLDEETQALFVDKYLNGMSEEELLKRYHIAHNTLYCRLRKGKMEIEEKTKIGTEN